MAMKKSGKRILRFAAVLCLICFCLLSGCGKKKTEKEPANPDPSSESSEILNSEAETESRTEDDVIDDIITYYGFYKDEADQKEEELLAELTAMDEEKGNAWREILDYWKYTVNEMVVNTDGLPDNLPQDDSLCIVVLGYQLNADGSMKDELTGRLTTALKCAGQYPNAYVLCTGGGTASLNPGVTEAGQMGEWLLNNGLEKERLIVEDKSLTTAENAINSYGILRNDYPQVNSIAMVSSSYHVPWGSLLFETTILNNVSETQSPEIHVISGCGYPVENDVYKESDEIVRRETCGMLQLIGRNERASQFYQDYGSGNKPPL
ncbi:MAG: YdcF family protein [Lachnospiraceae bacterium]|nr:YdcF family protein [Lachnospiraceae bacterium]